MVRIPDTLNLNTPYGHKIKTLGGLARGQAALDDLSHNILGPGQSLRVVCLQINPVSDPICSAAVAPGVGTCRPSGTLYIACEVPPDRLGRLSQP